MSHWLEIVVGPLAAKLWPEWAASQIGGSGIWLSRCVLLHVAPASASSYHLVFSFLACADVLMDPKRREGRLFAQQATTRRRKQRPRRTASIINFLSSLCESLSVAGQLRSRGLPAAVSFGIVKAAGGAKWHDFASACNSGNESN